MPAYPCRQQLVHSNGSRSSCQHADNYGHLADKKVKYRILNIGKSLSFIWQVDHRQRVDFTVCDQLAS